MQGTNDPCRVPESETEYFDCCNRETSGSTETEAICNYVGTFHLIFLLAVIFG